MLNTSLNRTLSRCSLFPHHKNFTLISKPNLSLPRSVKFKTRQHVNPLKNTDYGQPSSPSSYCWSKHFPHMKEDDRVSILDIGCGHGKFLLELSRMYPDHLLLGMEIRQKVAQFVDESIQARRDTESKYFNVSVIWTNAMRYLRSYISEQQLLKVFINFPDPYFKRRQFKRRFVNQKTVSDIADLLRKDGRIYTITDVKDLHDWNHSFMAKNPYLEPVSEEDLQQPDLEILSLMKQTDEALKGEIEKEMFISVFQKI
ncbi:unnamed protein product [Moneuplotes crassus]|uniref:tRNA (guanine-N(7)-)-methyltransferase n=1 Tax=Euplotes crassus TaxID=5936 RepID=A0AAD1XT06_EUPCR|nr:unnamed protein product [Moneuplotes crassus]